MNETNIPNNQLFPDTPPDSIFTNRANRQLPSTSVAQDYITYLYDRVEYKENEGIFTYYKGVELPRNGLAFSQAVYAINSTKRLIIHVIKFFQSKELLFPFTKKNRIILLEKALTSFNDLASLTMGPYFLERGYYCKTSKEVRAFVTRFLTSLGANYDLADKTGEIFAMIFEFDDAYRFPFQDIMSETTKELLINDFPNELKRLLELQYSRENTGKDPNAYNRLMKFRIFGRALKVVWYIPSLRKALKDALLIVNFKNWQLDDRDIFHTLLYGDYNVRGKTLDERVNEYKALYDNDESKMPPRVRIELK